MLAFVNHFLINSCEFLNDFVLKCESKFIELERKLQKVEVSLTILEAKVYILQLSLHINNNGNFLQLASIPDIKQKDVVEQQPIKQTFENINNEPIDEIQVVEPKVEETSINGIKVSEHDDYKKFFKMLQVGVPAQAIKMKMQVEGLDPNILE